MMDQLEQNLRDVVLTEPPLGIDPDRVADVAARRQKMRRSGFATGVGVLAVGALAAGATAFVGAGSGGGGGGGGDGAGQVVVTPAKPTGVREFDQEVQRNVDRIQYLLGKMLPGKHIELSVTSDASPEQPQASMDVVVKIGGSSESMGINVVSPSTYPDDVTRIVTGFKDECKGPRDDKLKANNLRCDVTQRTDNSWLAVMEGGTRASHGHPAVVTTRNSANVHQDGGLVQVGDSGRTITPTLTTEQVITLSTDPKLGLHRPRG